MALPQLPPSSLADRVIASVSPNWALSRMRARAQMAIAGQWLGGSTLRNQTLNWLPYGGSPDTDMLVDRRWLRNRSRDMQRNMPLARGAINTVVTSSVGTGLSLRVRIEAAALGMTPEGAREWQETTESEFSLWADNPSMCDAERTLDFYQIQALAFRSALESGDVFAPLPMVPRPGMPYDLKIQLVEADRVTNKGYAPDMAMLFGGVQRDNMGAPVAYHIARRHPGGMMSLSDQEWDIIPAFGAKTGRRNVVHLFDKLRPGQGRGIPYLAPVVETLKQLSDYTDGELRAALVASLFTVFVKTDTGFGLDPDSTGFASSGPQPTGSNVKLGSGAIVDLAPGEDVTMANPGRPNPAFDGFVLALLRQVGVALELPFEVLVKHFNSSYSASRAALLEAWRFFKGRRAWLAAMFCQPVYEAFMDEAVALGRISAPGYFDDPLLRAAYLRADWVGDSQGQIDPLKEVQATKERLALLLTTYSDETAALNGQDWEDVVERRKFEEQLIDDSNLRPVLIAPGIDPTKVDPNDPNVDPTTPGTPGQPGE